MAEVFKELYVFHRNQGGTIVLWSLDPVFSNENPGPNTFSLEVSLPGVGDWTLVDTTVDNNWITDPTKRVYAKWVRLSYRVRLIAADGVEYVSRVKQATGNFYGRDFNVVREVIRKENVQLKVKGGACGWLYKRKHWGVDCEKCTNFHTGEVSPDENCTTCFGTGLEGGYWDPIEYWMGPSSRAQSEWRRLQTQEKAGLTDNAVFFRRGIACPWVDTLDLWVDFDSDERFFVGRIWPVEYRLVPIIYDPIELKLVRADDIVYKLPRPDESSVPM